MTLTIEELQELKSICEKATPGPWHDCCGKCFQVGSSGHPIATIEHGEWGDSYPSLKMEGPSMNRTVKAYMEFSAYGSIPEDEAKANVELIALSRTIIPNLIGELEALRECVKAADAVRETIWVIASSPAVTAYDEARAKIGEIE